MFRASVGGRDAAHAVHRHVLVRLMIPLLGVLATGRGGSPFSLGGRHSQPLPSSLVRRGGSGSAASTLPSSMGEPPLAQG